jgi:DNA-binding transcriptional ArsR family regulator
MKHARESLDLEDAAQAFSALGSESRLFVLRTLVRAGPEGLSMGELAQRTEIPASTLTHHLRFLTQSNLVQQTRKGRSIICAAAAFETVQRLSRFLIEECCADACPTHQDLP